MRVSLVLAFLCATASIASADKPKLWILDLDAADDARGPARELAALLRDQATTAASPYALHTDDDSADRCKRDVTCLAALARDRGADFVVAGAVKVSDSPDGFAVELRFVDAATARERQRWQAFVPRAESFGVELRAWAAKGYAILADDRGQPIPQDAPRVGDRGWKFIAAVAAASTVVFGTGFFIYFGKLRETGPSFQLHPDGSLILDSQGRPTPAGAFAYGGYCQLDRDGTLRPTAIDETGQVIPTPAACHHGDLYRGLTYVTALGMLAGTAFTGVAVYKGFIQRESPKRREVVVMPMVSPEVAGAALWLSW